MEGLLARVELGRSFGGGKGKKIFVGMGCLAI